MIHIGERKKNQREVAHQEWLCYGCQSITNEIIIYKWLYTFNQKRTVRGERMFIENLTFYSLIRVEILVTLEISVYALFYAFQN